MDGNKEQPDCSYQDMLNSEPIPTAKPRHPSQINMHSLLNVKLASLAENSHHTTMTPDAIASYYDESPDCSPPNGYHSPNPSPPNGFHSPNPTPPNGYLANTHAVFHDIVNPPIMFYGDDTVTRYDEDQFMKTMRILTSAHHYNELAHLPSTLSSSQPNIEQLQLQRQQQQQQQQQQEQRRRRQVQNAEKKRESVSMETKNKNNKNNKKIKEATPATKSVTTTATTSSSSPTVAVSATENLFEYGNDDDELEIINEEDLQVSQKRPNIVLSKEDKRRRNTAASARFRVKKKLREQALQHTADEMTDKANRLQSRVHELEREVQWLKALIVEKKDSRFERLLM